MKICPLFLQAMIAKGIIESGDLLRPTALISKFPVSCIESDCGFWNNGDNHCGQSNQSGTDQLQTLEAIGSVLQEIKEKNDFS